MYRVFRRTCTLRTTPSSRLPQPISSPKTHLWPSAFHKELHTSRIRPSLTTIPANQNQSFDIQLIHQLASENPEIDAPWYLIATAAFSAANAGPIVIEIWKAATANRTVEERLIVFRRIRETLLKATMVIGLPRMLNSYFPLAGFIINTEKPEALASWGDSVRGRGNSGDPERRQRGEDYLKNIYRKDVPQIRSKMEGIAPEIWDACILGYSEYLSELGLLNRVETSQATIGGMIPQDVKTEVEWHIRGLIRNEGTMEQVKHALEISLKVCEVTGIELKHGIPDMNVVQKEILFDLDEH